MEISEKEFLAYEAVRVGGLTNMFDIHNVSWLAEMGGTKLSRDKIIAIQTNYIELKQKYVGDK